MNREQKEQFIQTFQDKLTTTQSLFLVGYPGLTVAQSIKLRKELNKDGGEFQVTKVTLLKRAIEGKESLQALDPYLKNQIAVVFGNQASTAVAKTLNNFSKANPSLSILAGCVDNVFLNANDFKAFVTLPPREILLAQVCGTMKAPIAQFVGILKILLARLAFVLKEIEKQKTS